jgi:hypothetical protein
MLALAAIATTMAMEGDQRLWGRQEITTANLKY